MKFDHLRTQFTNKSSNICIIGLGYVGLPLAFTFAKAGYHVTGIDINIERVKQINSCNFVADGIDSEEIKQLISLGLFRADSSFASIQDCHATIICVPTPLDTYHDPDLSYVIKAAEEVANHAPKDMLVVLESTVYPGTTKEILEPIFVRKGFTIGENLFLCFSPERVDPGRKDWTTFNTPKIIGGITPKCLEMGKALYSNALQTIVPVSSTEMAEMTKILENSFRAINIAFINEMMTICDTLKLNIWELVEAAGTKPFGFMKFNPGPGVGGHCIPIDPLYLTWKLKQMGKDSEFISLAHKINTSMPHYWVQKVKETLMRQNKPLSESRILVLGVAYKKDCEDYRESPSLDILQLLIESGACVEYYDPYVPSVHVKNTVMHRVTDLFYALQTSDCVVIATDHSYFNQIDFSILACRVVNCKGDKISDSVLEMETQKLLA